MKIALPLVPRYIVPISKDGYPDQPFEIGHLDDESIEKICELWKQHVFMIADRQRKGQKFKDEVVVVEAPFI